jgi:hypothetical protein
MPGRARPRWRANLGPRPTPRAPSGSAPATSSASTKNASLLLEMDTILPMLLSVALCIEVGQRMRQEGLGAPMCVAGGRRARHLRGGAFKEQTV